MSYDIYEGLFNSTANFNTNYNWKKVRNTKMIRVLSPPFCPQPIVPTFNC